MTASAAQLSSVLGWKRSDEALPSSSSKCRLNAQVNRRRSAKRTNTSHKNAKAMASVGVRVEPTVQTTRDMA